MKEFDWLSIFEILDELVTVVDEKLNEIDGFTTESRYLNPEYLKDMSPEIRKNTEEIANRIKQTGSMRKTTSDLKSNLT